ncbi:hypothetical protein EZV62_007375 [Acer yangbiense]|uniref:NB-ARC domain-containing protein n=1 Tax=Acer yangbiense TaxID=1000413 RepID=A0A5C7I9W4_9ROSI|nr:hypothetical protein EZV62_007375 [Acer yangbiense]
MVEVAVAVAAKVVEYLVAPIARPLIYIWNYSSNFQNLDSEVRKLKGKRDAVQHSVDNARRNGEEIERHVQDWLESVKKTIDEASEIQEKEQSNMKCFKGLCVNPKKRYQYSTKAVYKAKAVVGLQQEANFEKVSYPITPEETWLPSSKGYEAFESRMSTLNDIIKALSNPNVNMVGVYGAGGIGKTTLARAVAEHAEYKKLFDVVAFAEVFEVPDIRRIQGEIADKLGLTFHEESVTGRARKLHKCLKQKKQEEQEEEKEQKKNNDLKKLKEKKEPKKEKEEKEQEKKILLVLDNLWARLELDKVGIPFGDDHKGCKLLLTARDLDALTAMGSQHNFCMDVLKDEEALNLFNTTAGDCIEQSDLEVLAKDVAEACGGLPIAIVTTASALKNKKQSEWKNALQELGRPSVRNFEGVAAAAYKSIEVSYSQLKDRELKSTFLLCSMMGYISTGNFLKYGVGLGMFESINTLEEARDRVGMPELRVLHLVGFDLLSLPTSLGLLVNLRALCMDKCEVKDIALIGELKVLEILNFRDSKIMRLPVEICKLIGLRLLDLNGCSNLKDIPPNFISRLTRLEELYLGGTSIQWEVQGRSKTCLDELKRLSHLSTLEISILHTKHETSRKLELNLGTSCSCFDFEDVPPKTPSVKNILSVLDGQGFPELEQLWVQDGPCLLTVVDSFESESRDPFPSLETLVLHKIFSIGREEDKIQLKELHSMTLARLPQLTVFCSASEVILEEEVDTLTPFFNEKDGFPSLEKIEVFNLDNLKIICQEQQLA